MFTPPPWQNDVCLIRVSASPSLVSFFNWSDESKWPGLACALIHKWSHRHHWFCWGACFISTWPEGCFYGLSSHHYYKLERTPRHCSHVVDSLSFHLNVTNPLDMLQIHHWHSELWSSSWQRPRSSAFWISMLLLRQILHCQNSFHSWNTHS